MSTVTLDWDKVRTCGIPAADPAVFQPPRPIANEFSSSSSIDQAESGVRLPQHRPHLEPPRHYMIDLLEMHLGVEEVVAKEVTLFRCQSKIDLADIERLEKEKEELFRKHAFDAASRNNWGVLGTVAQYLAAGTSIAVGASLLSNAPWAGTLLMVSGVAGLGNRVMHETDGWEALASWFTKSVEYQKKVAQICAMSCLSIELGVGLAGGAMAYSVGAFSFAAANRKAIADTTAVSIKVASQGLGASSQLGKSFTEQRMSVLQGRMRIVDALAEQTRMEMSHHAGDTRNMIETAQAIGQEMHKAIAALETQDL